MICLESVKTAAVCRLQALSLSDAWQLSGGSQLPDFGGCPTNARRQDCDVDIGGDLNQLNLPLYQSVVHWFRLGAAPRNENPP